MSRVLDLQQAWLQDPAYSHDLKTLAGRIDRAGKAGSLPKPRTKGRRQSVRDTEFDKTAGLVEAQRS